MDPSVDWEDTKENYVPVKQGRSAAALSTPLSVSKRSNEVEKAKKYIKWVQEQFAANGSKAELQQVLEAATRSLSGTNRYNNDVRLLRIWVQYADCLPDPSDVFLHLAERDIGRDHALLYEAYATYLELKGNFQQAELVYQDGINRLAKPTERLKQKLAAFQQRMAKPFPAAAGPSQATHLPAYAVSRKENTAKTGQLAGTKLQQQGMFTAPVAARLEGNRPHAAAAGGGARYGSSFSGSMQQPGGVLGSGGSSSGAEPTVTINTRAAFDAMNDMFGDMTGQQTLTGRQMGMAHGRGDRRAGTSRLSMAAGGGMSGMGMGLYEDTEFVGSKLAAAGAAAAAGGGLGLCEDTEFITCPVGAAAAAGRGGLGGSGGGGGSSNSLGLCEDTEFITRPVGGNTAARSSAFGGGAAGSNGGGLGLCEDTEFITRPMGGAAASRRSGLGGAAAGGGLGLCEDTQFITRPVGAAAGTAGGGGLSLYEDTEFVGNKLAAAGAAAGGGLGLCEDTEFITRPVAAAPAAAAAAAAGVRGGFARAGLGGSRVQQRLPDEASDSTTGLLRVKENLPAASHAGQQQQQRVPLGQAALGGAGLAEHGSRSGQPVSAPNSPGHSQQQQQQQQQHPGPAWGAVTPGKPPAGPGAAAITPGRQHPGARTPGTPWARPMEDFEVMDSPAVRAALAERPSLAMSPVASMPSPGFGAQENRNPEGGDARTVQRSLCDTPVRAAALQPLSDTRAELLGVHVDPDAAPGKWDAEDAEGDVAAAPGHGTPSRLGRGRALRSLRFPQHESGQRTVATDALCQF
ncbi:hypothetical protein OEZ86_001187 [Tetradesmus obliquus]|nr:hypothetical protein OEZ86_001187 [Tetradesmus obliquus]